MQTSGTRFSGIAITRADERRHSGSRCSSNYRDCQVADGAKVVREPRIAITSSGCSGAYRATGDVRYCSAVVEQLVSWIGQCPFGRG